MLSRHSDSSVAAVGVVNQIIMLTFLIFEVINLGTSVLCSQYLGARLQKKVVQVVGVSILVNIVIGVSVSLFLFSCAGPILRLMGLTPELMTDGMDYMRIVGAFAFFQAISLTLSASLRSANKAIYPMLVTVVVNILNIIGNYSLIFGRFGFPELGVEGAAISTAFSRGVSMVLLFIILFRKHIHRFPVAYFRPFPWPELKNLMKVGLPSAGEQLSYSSSQVVITFSSICWASKHWPPVPTASTLSCSPTSSALPWHKEAPSASVISSERENLMLPSLMGKYVMKKSVMITVILSTVLAVFGNTIFHWLTSNEEIIRLGTTILIIDVILEIGRPINILPRTLCVQPATSTTRFTSDWWFSGALPSGWDTSSVFLWNGASVVCGLPSCWMKTSGELSSYDAGIA